MSNKFSSEWEFPKFMTYHVFCNENGSMNFSIVNTEGVPNELWSNCTSPRPCLDNSFLSWLIKPFNFLNKSSVYVRSFFKTTCHSVDGLNEVKWCCVKNSRLIREVFLDEFVLPIDQLSFDFESSLHELVFPKGFLDHFVVQVIDVLLLIRVDGLQHS